MSVSGDLGVGDFVPQDVRPANFRRVPKSSLAKLRQLTGVSATTSDVLDELGLTLAIPSHLISLRTAPVLVVGQAITVRYLPERRAPSNPSLRRGPSRLTHHVAFSLAAKGDIVVFEVGSSHVSALGGIAAQSATKAGIAGCIVDGGIRDLEQIESLGLPVWARIVTPTTGKWRVEAVAINVPIACGGVQVHPGDLVIADETGICFIPVEMAEAAIDRIVAVARLETKQINSSST